MAITAAAATIKGTVGKGAILAIGSASSTTFSTTLQAIGGITDITGSGVKVGTVATTDLSSPNVTRAATTIDYGTVSATIKDAESDAGQTAVQAAALALVPYDFSIQYNDIDAQKTVTIDFSAIVTEFGAVTLEDEKLNTSKVELTLSGPWAITSTTIA